MGDFSLNRPTALEFSKRPSSPSLNLYSGRIAASVFSTVSSTVSRTISNAVVGSSISLTALYLANINGRPRLCSDPSNFFEWLGCQLASSTHPDLVKSKEIKWLDYPAGYIPPKMDLFSDDPIPFGFSPPSCPVSSEHLERSFDLLRYRHAFKQLGVPSVVDSEIRIVTSATGSESRGGTSTNIGITGSGSANAPSHPVDRRRVQRDRGWRNGGSSNGSGSGGTNTGPPSLPESIKPSGQRQQASKHRSGPPPPPPPPPGPSGVEDDDHDPAFSSDWDLAWKAILLGAVIGHLLRHILSNREQILRKVFRAAPPKIDLDLLEADFNDVDISGIDKARHLEFDSDVATLPGFVDEVFRMDLPKNYTDVKVNNNPGDAVVTSWYDTLLKQFSPFPAGTAMAIAQSFSLNPFSLVLLFILALYALCRKAITCYRMAAVTMLPGNPGTAWTPADKETFPNVDIPEDDDTVEVDDDTVYVHNEVTSVPAETLYGIPDVLRVPHIEVETTHVEAFAPESGSLFDMGGTEYTQKMDDTASEGFVSASPSTKSFSGLVADDSFNWDRHGSFMCSTPLAQTGSLPSAESFNFGRAVFDEFDISVADSDTAIITEELEQTRKNLDTIIEAQIRRAESSYGARSRLDPFDSYLRTSTSRTTRSLSSSMWSSTSATSSCQDDRFIPSVRRVPVNHTSSFEFGTVSEHAQKPPGRRRRYRPRPSQRNRGRRSNGELFVEEEPEPDISSDVPDWANA